MYLYIVIMVDARIEEYGTEESVLLQNLQYTVP